MFNQQKKQEIKKQKDRLEEEAKILKEKVKKFFDEEIRTLDISVEFVEEAVPMLLSSLIKAYKAQSEEFKAVIAAREVISEKSIKDLTVVKFDIEKNVSEN